MMIAILSTGDELVHGDTINTNAQMIAQSLCSEGLMVGLHLSCSDTEADIIRCLDFLCQQHDLIILTGGLGPTSDDRTRFALARFLNISLVDNIIALQHVKSLLNRANLECNEGNLQQALFPEHAVLLPNPQGTAMGCLFAHNNKQFILLPGPPRECLPMFNDHALKHLQALEHHDKQVLKWQLFAVAEGSIAKILDDALSAIDCETGYRLDTPYVEFKVRCRLDCVDDVKKIIDPIVKPYIISPPQFKASECLRTKIRELNIPIVIIDKATGGMLQKLIQRPSNYHLINFHDSNVQAVRFDLCGLEDYWLQLDSSVTSVSINYVKDGEQKTETHSLPFRNQRVVDIAAEWLSFRLLHLIDQLH